MQRKVRINLTDFWHPNTLEDKRNNLVVKLLAKRFDIEICDNPDFLLFSCFGVDFTRYDCTRIFYTGENVRPNYSLCDYAFGFDYSNDPRYMRFPYYAFVNLAPLFQPRDVDALMRRKTKFCAFVYSNNKARERLKFLDKLSRYKTVDCGGKVRNNLGFRVADKISFLQDYKFNIAFENESFPGYTTEKLAEAFAGNTLPIYWGNPLVDRDFNRQAFINCHDFKNLDQVVDFVVELDRNDELYRRYLSTPAFENNQPNEYLDETRVLDRFEAIFSQPPSQPAARTARGKLSNFLRSPKYYRRLLRDRRSAKRHQAETPG